MQAERHPATPDSRWRAPLAVAAFALALALTWVAAERLFFARRDIEVFSPKLDYLRAHDGQFDAVFIGSSRVYRHFVPEVFDAAADTRSFNLGCDALWAPESYCRLRELLARKPRLRWIFIELLPPNPRLPAQQRDTFRTLSWHDWTHTAMAWRAAARDPRIEPEQKRELYALHARLFLRRLGNIGRGALAIEKRLRPPTAKDIKRAQATEDSAEWRKRAGFVPGPATPIDDASRRALLGGVAAHRNSPPARPLPEDVRETLRGLVGAVRAIGATPVFVLTPSLANHEKVTGLRAQGIDADLLAFNDPVRHPALFDPAMHYDGPHLNERGAREFSRLLAEEFARLRNP